jgi:hypothetical protein
MALFAKKHLDELHRRLDGLLDNIGVNHPDAAADIVENRIEGVTVELRWLADKGMGDQARNILDEYATKDIPRFGVGRTQLDAEAALKAQEASGPDLNASRKTERWQMALREARRRAQL